MTEIIDTLMPFVWFIGIAVFGYFLVHRFSSVITARFKYSGSTKNYSGDRNIDQQLDAFIQNAPRLLAEIHDEIKKQGEAGVTDQQMKGLKSKESMLSFIVQNKEIIDIIGKPILKKLVGFIKAI